GARAVTGRRADGAQPGKGRGSAGAHRRQGLAPMTGSARLSIAGNADLVMVRQQVRGVAVEAGLSLIDQTKVVTAASELARNALVHAGGGAVTIEVVEDGRRRGLRLVFADEGPGIPDLEQALTDG